MSGWSAQQAQWLRALGHPVLVRRETDWPKRAGRGATAGSRPTEPASPMEPAGAVDAAPAAVAGRQGSPPRPVHRDAPPRPDTGPAATPGTTTAAPAPPRTDASAKLVALSRARRARDFGDPRFAPLLGQLLRAARIEGDAGRDRLRELEFDLTQLQRDPAAKRALWPALRALRRESRQ